MTDLIKIEEVEEFVYSLFKGERSCRGETECELIGPNTPCCDFFHSDVDGQTICIGRPIEEKFGLELFMFQWGMPHHSFFENRQFDAAKKIFYQDAEKAFYRKYPVSELPTEKHTLKRFAEMVYDLIRIKNGL